MVSVNDNIKRLGDTESAIDIEGLINIDNLKNFKPRLAIILGNEDIGLKFSGKIVAKHMVLKMKLR